MTEVELPQELCEYFQKISENDPVAYLSKMIAPHLVGNEWDTIRKTTLLSLASYGTQKTKKKRRIHTLLLGKPGTGKSVDGDTQVIIKQKNNIEIHKIKDTEKFTDFEALSVNPITLNVEWKKVNKVSKHEERRKVLKIIARRKQEVIATIDHSFLKYDFERDRLMPTKGDELKEGDLIPFISEIPVKINNTEYSITLNYIGIEELREKAHIWRDRLVKMLPLEQYEKMGSRGWQIPYEDAKIICPNLKPKKIVFPLDYDFGFLTGFWIAEGHMDKKGGVYFSNTNKNILKYIQTTLKKIPAQGNKYCGGYFVAQRKIKKMHKTCWRLRVQNTYLFDFLSLFGKGARSKIIPSICFNFSNEFISGLLCGYFTGDGTIGGNISATTTSKKLADGISLLLLKLKIGNYVKSRDGDAYKIMIPSQFTKIFAEKIGFKGKKKKTLENILKKDLRNCTAYIPINYDLFKKHTKGMLSYNYDRVNFIRGISKDCKKGRLTKDMAKKFNILAKSSILDKLIKSNTYWSPITSIEKIDCNGWVYDFSVQDNENFVLANGMVVHNTELMLWWQDNLQGVMVNSENTSKAGLVGDARGGEITPGLLAELDGNFVLLDELDKMSTQDANGLLQAMEEGSYKIIKGKHRKRFQAEIRVIASANEVKKIQPPLLDRFDFIYHCTTSTREDRARNVPRITASFFGDNDEKNATILNGYMIWLGDTTPSAFEDKKTIDTYIANYIKKVKEVDVTRASYRFLEMSIMRIAWAIAKLHKREAINPKDVEDAIIFKHDTMQRIHGINIKKEGKNV